MINECARSDRRFDTSMQTHKYRFISKKRGNYCVVEKAEPDPLDLSANIGVGKQFFMPYCV